MADLAGGLCPEAPVTSGLSDHRAEGALILHDVPKSGLSDRRAAGAVMNLGAGGGVAISLYHKRAWDSDTDAYVEWDSTTPTGAYPGTGTLDPPLGTVMWTK